jgi:hypothetical protein
VIQDITSMMISNLYGTSSSELNGAFRGSDLKYHTSKDSTNGNAICTTGGIGNYLIQGEGRSIGTLRTVGDGSR